ncbi:MAG: ABC transporter ATP-binding protein [Candidatus Latescibacteria bacterium]|nr:ABC transporter ATP-binding protein [Candidatus Latescibacterota bacterium]
MKPLLEARQLYKTYRGRDHTPLRAVDGVNLALELGQVLALVGESGCGKSTLALTLAGLEKPSEGQVLYEGEDIALFSRDRLQVLRRRIQVVLQDPYESLNPTMSVGQLVAEPLQIHGLAGDRDALAAQVGRALERVGLTPAADFVPRRPHQLSGGQRQRVAIACALVLEPVLLVADEPVSMLDASIRAGILSLLADLRRERHIGVLFITHDLAAAACLADQVAVMYLGRIVEQGPTPQVLGAPRHPYTRALLAALPPATPRQRRPRALLAGETPGPGQIPPGCRFHPRCPLAAPACGQLDPPLVVVDAGHRAACPVAAPAA